MKIVISVFCLLFAFSIAWSETYQWVDEKGTVHFTQDFNSIPEKFRDQVKTREDRTEDSGRKIDKKDSKGSSKGEAKEPVKEKGKKNKKEDEPKNVRKVESEVTDTFTIIMSLWKEGKYEALYEYGTSSSRASMAKESFVSKMRNKRLGLAASWETFRDVKVEVKNSKLAYVSARIGYKPKHGGDTTVRTETYTLKLEKGIWRVDLSKLLKTVK